MGDNENEYPVMLPGGARVYPALRGVTLVFGRTRYEEHTAAHLSHEAAIALRDFLNGWYNTTDGE